MGSLFGSTKTPTQTSVSQPTLPAYLERYITDAASQAQDLYKQGSLANPYYPNSTVATPSAATQAGINSMIARATNGSPLQASANNQFQSTINGDYLNANSNPYLRSAMDAANRGTVEQFGQSVLPSLQANFSKAGRSSSDAMGNTIARTSNGLARTLADSNATMAANNYTAERGNQLNAAQQAPTMAAADYNDAQKLLAAGGIQDEQSQNQLNDQINRYNAINNPQLSSLQNYINLLNQTAGSVGNGSTSTTYGTQNNTLGTMSALSGLGSMFASGAGGTSAASGLGSALMTGMSFFSDSRLKTNIKRIGKMPNGLNIYSYNYVWGGPQVAGVMAHEVEQVIPQAVSVHASGFKQVNYGML